MRFERLGLFLQGFQLIFPFFQLLIGRKFPFQSFQLADDLLPLGRQILLFFQKLLSLLRLGPLLLQLLFGFFQLLLGLFPLFRLAQLGVDLGQLLFQLFQLTAQLFFPPPVLGRKPLQHIHCLFQRQLILPGLLSLIRQGISLLPLDALHILAHALPGLLTFLALLKGQSLDSVLEHHIIPGLEYFPENFLPAFGVGQKELEEIPLGDHGDLRKLVSVQTDNLGNGGRDFPWTGDDAPIGQMQLPFRLLGGHPFAALGRALVFRIAAQSVLLASISKFQLHKGGSLRACILGAEHGSIPVLPTGLPVQCVGNGIKQGGFPGPCVSGDQVEPFFSQLFQLYHRFPCIGSKGRHGQFQWSHGSSSQISSISPKAKDRWVSCMGWPFCFS